MKSITLLLLAIIALSVVSTAYRIENRKLSRGLKQTIDSLNQSTDMLIITTSNLNRCLDRQSR